jgi:hypothetical protein
MLGGLNREDQKNCPDTADEERGERCRRIKTLEESVRKVESKPDHFLYVAVTWWDSKLIIRRPEPRELGRLLSYVHASCATNALSIESDKVE